MELYTSDGYEVNQLLFCLHINDHGIIIRNPSVKEKIEYLFSFLSFQRLKYSLFKIVGCHYMLAKDDEALAFIVDGNDIPINQPEEVVFHNTLKCIIEESFNSMIIKLN